MSGIPFDYRVGGRPAVLVAKVAREVALLNHSGIRPTLSQIQERLPEAGYKSLGGSVRKMLQAGVLLRTGMPGYERVGQYVLASCAHQFDIEVPVQQQLLCTQSQNLLQQLLRETPEVRARRKREREAKHQWHKDEAKRQARGLGSAGASVLGDAPSHTYEWTHTPL